MLSAANLPCPPGRSFRFHLNDRVRSNPPQPGKLLNVGRRRAKSGTVVTVCFAILGETDHIPYEFWRARPDKFCGTVKKHCVRAYRSLRVVFPSTLWYRG
jgi:hypothetical protein